MQADILAISALACHPLSVPTALTVQDNVRVFAVHALDAELIRHQAQVLIDRFPIRAVKLGIVGNRHNAATIATLILQLRTRWPDLPVVFDPVLANGHGDALSSDDGVHALEPLYALATIITPNLNESERLCGRALTPEQQASTLMQRGCRHVLLKGGHGPQQEDVLNRWFGPGDAVQSWRWPRLSDEFHGSGCTLAAALAAQLALGLGMCDALTVAQEYCQQALASSYAIAAGQRIPNRLPLFQEQKHG